MNNYSNFQPLENNNNLSDSISIETINTITDTPKNNEISEISNISDLESSNESSKNLEMENNKQNISENVAVSESSPNLFKELPDSLEYNNSILESNNIYNNKSPEKKNIKTENIKKIDNNNLEINKDSSINYNIFIFFLGGLLLLYFLKRKK